MIEILPNWHPIFVHFTVALVTISVGLFVLSWLFSRFKFGAQCWFVGKWCLWLGLGFGIITVLAGFYAFNTVAHDEASHIVMSHHRNWALATATGVIILSIWAWIVRDQKSPKIIFVICSLIVFILLLITAWHGGELVYRHGVGVMSLPKADHHHNDGDHHDGDHDHSD